MVSANYVQNMNKKISRTMSLSYFYHHVRLIPLFSPRSCALLTFSLFHLFASTSHLTRHLTTDLLSHIFRHCLHLSFLSVLLWSQTASLSLKVNLNLNLNLNQVRHVLSLPAVSASESC